MKIMNNQVKLRGEIRPGDLGYVTYLHGKIYAAENQLDFTFEGYVAAGLGEFARTYDEQKDRLWLAETGQGIVGSIAIAGSKTVVENSAQIRWFLVHPTARGSGLGKRLVHAAVEFCRERHFDSIFLWTVSELLPAAHLYRAAGFRVTEEKTHAIWGRVRTEQRYELKL